MDSYVNDREVHLSGDERVGLSSGGGKNPLLSAGGMKVMSLVTLIPLRKLFIPVSPAWLEKAPHIL